MANVTITIPTPIITSPAKFRTRYRELPSGVFSSYVDRDNTPFVLSVSEGEYELEVIYVNAQGVECSTIFQYFTVEPDFECATFTASTVNEGGIYKIKIEYPTDVDNPPCGWNIFYQHGSGVTANIPYTTLPTSGVIKIVVPDNRASYVRVEANMCGELKYCLNSDVPGIPPPPCTPISGVTYNIREVRNPQTNRCEYFLDVTFTQSNPVSTQVTLNYLQSGTSIFNPDQFSGTINIPTTPTASFTKKLNPKLQAGQECTQYNVSVIDRCNNGLNTTIPYCRTLCFHETP